MIFIYKHTKVREGGRVGVLVPLGAILMPIIDDITTIELYSYLDTSNSSIIEAMMP